MKNKFKYVFFTFGLVLMSCGEDPVAVYEPVLHTEDTTVSTVDSLPIDTLPNIVLPDFYTSGTFKNLEFKDLGDFLNVVDETGKPHAFYCAFLANGHPLLTNEDRFKGRQVKVGWKKVNYYSHIDEKEIEMDSIVTLEWSGFVKTIGKGGDYGSPAMAIKALQKGDTLKFMPGVYEFSETLELWGISDVTIIGGSLRSSILVCKDKKANVLSIVNCKNIVIDYLAATHLKPSENEQCTGNVIVIEQSENIRIKNCDINGCGAIGVYGSGSKNIVLEGNHIHNNSLWAVYWEGEGLMEATDSLKNLRFVNNLIEKNGRLNPALMDSVLKDSVLEK